MMKIGCCAYSYRDHILSGEMNLESFIEESYKIRLDGVELTGYYFKSKEKSYLYRLKRLCLEKGLSISMVSCGAHLWSPREEDVKRDLDEIKRWVKVAYELGAPCLRVFGGRWPPAGVLAGFTIDDAIEVAIEVGGECADFGSDYGVVIALENHGGITRFADDVIRIIRGVSSEWFRLNLDTGNYRDHMYEDIKKSAPYAVHVHAKTGVRHVGSGIEIPLDYGRIRRILEDVGYNGWVSIEYEAEEDPKIGVPRFAEELRRVFR